MTPKPADAPPAEVHLSVSPRFIFRRCVLGRQCLAARSAVAGGVEVFGDAVCCRVGNRPLPAPGPHLPIAIVRQGWQGINR